jgi:hypothetical protein
VKLSGIIQIIIYSALHCGERSNVFRYFHGALIFEFLPAPIYRYRYRQIFELKNIGLSVLGYFSPFYKTVLFLAGGAQPAV